MEEIAEQASKTVDRTENDVTDALKKKEPVYPGLEPLLAKFRTACQDFIFLNFHAAASKKTESRLWNAHSRVNLKFRPFLARFREGDGKKKHVERRKAEKLYLEFIKSSMRFYRGYIQRLASHFSDVPEILGIARKFSLDTLSVDAPEPVDGLLKKQLVRSCYSTLVQLGDLSRYRETELQTKERNWGPAKGYYDLATALDPSSGMSYNQLAVISLTDQDHIRAVYYLYRAVCVQNPAPPAQGNLELEFKKIRTKSTQGKPITGDDAMVEGSRDLQNRFLLFHARCLEEGFAGYEDQQTEILRLLADHLREQPYDTIIRKFCLINLAAEEFAVMKLHSDSSPQFAFQFFKISQSFNVRTFFQLLRLLLDEFQEVSNDADNRLDSASDGPLRISSVTRRILPHLRLYSNWLLSTVHVLLGNPAISVQLRELWQVYAEALTLLVHTFPIEELPAIQYLLDEDQDTMAFTAFSDFVRSVRFCDNQAHPKPSHSDEAFGSRSPEMEMLYRIKCLVEDGVRLSEKQGLCIPLRFANNRFICDEEGAEQGEENVLHVSMHAPTTSAGSISRDDIEHAKRFQPAAAQEAGHHEAISDAGVSGSMTSMENMVNRLTQLEAPDGMGSSALHGPPTPTLNTPMTKPLGEIKGSLTARDLVEQFQQSSNASTPVMRDFAINRRVLTPIWDTAFTPRPGETPESSPRPSTAHRFTDSGLSGHLNSQAQFQANLSQMQHQIQMRTSPPESFQPTLSSNYETTLSHSTHWTYVKEQPLPPSSPWQSSFSAVPIQETVISTRPPESSPFGAIGQPPPKKNRTPTRSQVG